MDLRDELAVRMAAALAASAEPPVDDRAIANRAYELADALLDERALALELEPRWLEPPYEPAWELEPRWSRADLARAAAKRASDRGPGLASARPVDPAIRKLG